ncbi:hypothetical protein F750_2371 [Streptomyces sp. PAMC 26508]|nr:hypothetical protein F750_2371 [Streptomyces sp. PAMC 26508]
MPRPADRAESALSPDGNTAGTRRRPPVRGPAGVVVTGFSGR